jgi:hypothetical protein
MDDKSNCSDWLGGNRWPPNIINTTTNHRIESRGNRRSLCRERQRKGCKHTTNSQKRGGWCGGTIMLLCCYIHNSKTKWKLTFKIYHRLNKYVN